MQKSFFKKTSRYLAVKNFYFCFYKMIEDESWFSEVRNRTFDFNGIPVKAMCKKPKMTFWRLKKILEKNKSFFRVGVTAWWIVEFITIVWRQFWILVVDQEWNVIRYSIYNDQLTSSNRSTAAMAFCCFSRFHLFLSSISTLRNAFETTFC